MSTKKSELLIQEFIGHVSKLADDLRAAVIAEAQEAFTQVAGGSASKGRPGPKPKAPPKKKGGKRTSEEIEAQGETILAYLKKNPSQGAEQLGAALGMSTGEMALPIAKLIAEKAVKFVGQKRGRKYSVKG